MGATLVSIVINNYNYEAYVGRAIESALAQTYPEIEVVVVDDGSTDRSRDIIARYAPRCTVVLQENGGQGAAYNAGFAASRGEIVLFLDSDDVLLPHAVEQVVGAWVPGRTAKIQFYLDVVDAAESRLGHRLPNIEFVPGAVLPLLLAYGYYPAPPASGNAYARGVLERLLPLPAAPWRNGADGYLIALAALYGDVVSLDEPLGLYRVHGANHSEAGGLHLALLRRRMRNELDREAHIKEHAAALGRRVTHSLALRIPAHCKARLLSLRFDPGSHPYPADSARRLVLAGIRAVWRFPHAGIAKRCFVTVAFPLLAVLPRRWLGRWLSPLFLVERRPRLLRWNPAATLAESATGG